MAEFVHPSFEDAADRWMAAYMEAKAKLDKIEALPLPDESETMAYITRVRAILRGDS